MVSNPRARVGGHAGRELDAGLVRCAPQFDIARAYRRQRLLEHPVTRIRTVVQRSMIGCRRGGRWRDRRRPRGLRCFRRRHTLRSRLLDLRRGGDTLHFQTPVVATDQRRDGAIGPKRQAVRRLAETVARVVLLHCLRCRINVRIAARDACAGIDARHHAAQAALRGCGRFQRLGRIGSHVLQTGLLALPGAIQFFADIARRLIRSVQRTGGRPFAVGAARIDMFVGSLQRLRLRARVADRLRNRLHRCEISPAELVVSNLIPRGGRGGRVRRILGDDHIRLPLQVHRLGRRGGICPHLGHDVEFRNHALGRQCPRPCRRLRIPLPCSSHPAGLVLLAGDQKRILRRGWTAQTQRIGIVGRAIIQFVDQTAARDERPVIETARRIRRAGRSHPRAPRIFRTARPFVAVTVGLVEDPLHVLLSGPSFAQISAGAGADQTGHQRARPGLGTGHRAIQKARANTAQNAAGIAADPVRLRRCGGGLIALGLQLQHAMAGGDEIVGHQGHARGADNPHRATRTGRHACFPRTAAFEQGARHFRNGGGTHERRRHLRREAGAQTRLQQLGHRQAPGFVRLRDGSTKRLSACGKLPCHRLHARLIDRIERRRHAAFRSRHSRPARLLRRHPADIGNLPRVGLPVAVHVAEEIPDLPVRLLTGHALRRVGDQITVDQSCFQRVCEFAHSDRHAFRSGAVAA